MVGTYIAGVLPVAIAFIDSPVKALVVLGFIVVYQQLENYFFAPRITARTMELHPAVAFGAALAGIELLGVAGAVLALPAAAMLQALAGEWGQRHDVVESELTVTHRSRAPLRSGILRRCQAGFQRDAFEPVAITSRSGFDESVHFGAAVVVDETGRIVWSIGDPTVEVYPRSACKPMQADAMLRCGLSLTARSSWPWRAPATTARPRHVDVVRSTLAAAGLDESALGNTPDLPLDVAAAEAILREGGRRLPITMNCSGKHAAMVATCVGQRLADRRLPRARPSAADRRSPTASPSSPVRVAHIGVDGCGAPAHVVTLDGLARAYGELARTRRRRVVGDDRPSRARRW